MEVIRLYRTTVCLHSPKEPVAFLVSQPFFETLGRGFDLDDFKG